jgi:hypothetical protein
MAALTTRQIEHQQDFEFQQDQNNPLTDEQIQAHILTKYLALYPVYENNSQYENSVFIIKNMGRITATVKTKCA